MVSVNIWSVSYESVQSATHVDKATCINNGYLCQGRWTVIDYSNYIPEGSFTLWNLVDDHRNPQWNLKYVSTDLGYFSIYP